MVRTPSIVAAVEGRSYRYEPRCVVYRTPSWWARCAALNGAASLKPGVADDSSSLALPFLEPPHIENGPELWEPITCLVPLLDSVVEVSVEGGRRAAPGGQSCSPFAWHHQAAELLHAT